MPDIQHPLQRDLTAGMRRGKIVSIEEAVDLIQDNDVIGFSGIIGIMSDEIICALGRSFKRAIPGPHVLLCLYLGDGGRWAQHLAHGGQGHRRTFRKRPTHNWLDRKIEIQPARS